MGKREFQELINSDWCGLDDVGFIQSGTTIFFFGIMPIPVLGPIQPLIQIANSGLLTQVQSNWSMKLVHLASIS
jgi:hypothetical protein